MALLNFSWDREKSVALIDWLIKHNGSTGEKIEIKTETNSKVIMSLVRQDFVRIDGEFKNFSYNWLGKL